MAIPLSALQAVEAGVDARWGRDAFVTVDREDDAVVVRIFTRLGVPVHVERADTTTLACNSILKDVLHLPPTYEAER